MKIAAVQTKFKIKYRKAADCFYSVDDGKVFEPRDADKMIGHNVLLIYVNRKTLPSYCFYNKLYTRPKIQYISENDTFEISK